MCVSHMACRGVETHLSQEQPTLLQVLLQSNGVREERCSRFSYCVAVSSGRLVLHLLDRRKSSHPVLRGRQAIDFLELSFEVATIFEADTYSELPNAQERRA